MSSETWETEGRAARRPPSLLAHPDRGDSLNARGPKFCSSFTKWQWREDQLVRKRFYCECRACLTPGCGDALAARDLRRAEVRLTEPTIFVVQYVPEAWTVKERDRLNSWRYREAKRGALVHQVTVNLIGSTWIFATAHPPGEGWRSMTRGKARKFLESIATVPAGLENMRFTVVEKADDPTDLLRDDPATDPSAERVSRPFTPEQHLGMCRVEIDELAAHTLREMAAEEHVDLAAADPDSRYKLVRRALAVAHASAGLSLDAMDEL